MAENNDVVARIHDEFDLKLQAEAVEPQLIESLRTLLIGDKPAKAEDFVNVFQQSKNGDDK